MSIDSELTRIENAKSSLRTSLIAQGQSISADDPIENYSYAVDNIPALKEYENGYYVDENYKTFVKIKDKSVASFSLNSMTDTILGSAFWGANNITALDFSNNSLLHVLCPSALAGLQGLTSIILPSGLKYIGQNAFSNCRALTSITIPQDVLTIDYSFQNCTSLQSVTLKGATLITGMAFSSCSALTSITIERNEVCELISGGIPASASHHITVYVPSNLIASYQVATNWSDLYNNGYIDFQAIA